MGFIKKSQSLNFRAIYAIASAPRVEQSAVSMPQGYHQTKRLTSSSARVIPPVLPRTMVASTSALQADSDSVSFHDLVLI